MSQQKKIGFMSLILLTINSIIGAGIFLSPGNVVKLVGSYAPLIFIFSGIFAMLLALSFASASRYVSKGGAAYAYAKAAFGEKIGFYTGITCYVAACIAWGVMITALVKTVYVLLGIEPTTGRVMVGFLTALIVFFTINILGIRILTFVNNFSTIIKVATLTLTIVACIYLSLKQLNIGMDPILSSYATPKINLTLSTLVTGILTAFYAYTGFERIASGTQDIVNPEKTIVRAIPIGLCVIMALYISIVSAALYFNPRALVESKDVVVLSSIFSNIVFKKMIMVGAVISMFGINVAASFHTPRVLESMAKEKQVPTFLVYRTERGVPIISFMLTCLLTFIIPLSFYFDMRHIMIVSSIARFLQFLIVPMALIAFYFGRVSESVLSTKRNFITDVFLPVLAIFFTILLLVWFDWLKYFSTMNVHGVVTVNYVAVGSLFTGFVVLPIVLYGIMKLQNTK